MGLVIHAPNVHQGGGRTLLRALLDAPGLPPGTVAQLDRRFTLPPDHLFSRTAMRVPPGIAARLAAEWRLRTLVKPGDVLLCFGNLPPLFGAPGHVVLFLQNRYVVSPRFTGGLPLRTRMRMAVERLWLRSGLHRAHLVLAQTPSMAGEIRRALGRVPEILPFAPPPTVPARPVRAANGDATFLYVASGEPHKNHINLLEAWARLAEDGLRPGLVLTVDPAAFPGLAAVVARHAAAGTRVRNAGDLEPARLAQLYADADAIVYPSRYESFGLPLLEAESRGIPIVAAELDYVRDVVDPAQTFDPESPQSIARAVKRFLKIDDSRARVLTPDGFIARLTERQQWR